MAKKYTIKNIDYYSRGDIQIEISEEIITPVEIKKTLVTVQTIEDTISFLKEKKKKIIADIDLEIQENQSILDNMQKQIDDVELKVEDEK